MSSISSEDEMREDGLQIKPPQLASKRDRDRDRHKRDRDRGAYRSVTYSSDPPSSLSNAREAYRERERRKERDMGGVVSQGQSSRDGYESGRGHYRDRDHSKRRHQHHGSRTQNDTRDRDRQTECAPNMKRPRMRRKDEDSSHRSKVRRVPDIPPISNNHFEKGDRKQGFHNTDREKELLILREKRRQLEMEEEKAFRETERRRELERREMERNQRSAPEVRSKHRTRDPEPFPIARSPSRNTEKSVNNDKRKPIDSAKEKKGDMMSSGIEIEDIEDTSSESEEDVPQVSEVKNLSNSEVSESEAEEGEVKTGGGSGPSDISSRSEHSQSSDESSNSDSSSEDSDNSSGENSSRKSKDEPGQSKLNEKTNGNDSRVSIAGQRRSPNERLDGSDLEIIETSVQKAQIASKEPEEEELTEVQKAIKDLQKLPSYFPAVQGCRRVEEFHLLNRIEEGTYGVVYRAKDRRTEEVVALKRLKMEKEKDGFPITSLREINTLLKSQHENVVTVREIVVGSNTDKIFLVMDYVEHDLKALMETLKQRGQAFSEGEIKCLMIQLLRAVAHLHDNWILHRDLKTSNLLLSHKGILKVGDFGLAREYGSPLKSYTPIVVTLWYRAPELLLGAKEYSTAIDVWSVGCIFGELLKMEPMFPGKSEANELSLIFQTLGTPNDRIWPGYSQLPLLQRMTFTDFPINKLKVRFNTLSELGIDLLNKFLTYCPAKRITAEAALNHPFFRATPLPIDPSVFPTWPAKSELGHKKGPSSPKPPSGGRQFKDLREEDNDPAGFFLGAGDRKAPLGAGFSLKF